MSSYCNVPPPGWRCTRLPGHAGSCAAYPDLPAEVATPAPVAESGRICQWCGVQGCQIIGWHAPAPIASAFAGLPERLQPSNLPAPVAPLDPALRCYADDMRRVADTLAPIPPDPDPAWMAAESGYTPEPNLGRLATANVKKERLTAALAALQQEMMKAAEREEILAGDILRMAEEHARLRELVHDVACSGVEFDDPQIDYVTVQVDRTTWDAIRDEIVLTAELKEQR